MKINENKSNKFVYFSHIGFNRRVRQVKSLKEAVSTYNG